MMFRRMLVAVLGLGLLTGAAGVAVAPAARAEPATAAKYPWGSASNAFKGQAFDTCQAPSVATLQAWLASPYRGVGVYVGGAGRACPVQPNLSPSWSQQVTGLGWRIIPIYVGRQAPCYTGSKPKITYAQATAQGGADGTDAINAMKSYALLPGSPVYLDIENYTNPDLECRVAVRRYVSGFTRALHAKGYLSGVYVNLSSGAVDLSNVYTSDKYARPDLLWIARYDGRASLKGWTGVSDKFWATHQRMKQYRGDRNPDGSVRSETYGGVTLRVDQNVADTAVATVAQPFTVQNGTANVWAGMSAKSEGRGTLAAGTAVSVICQGLGGQHHGTTVWDRLSDGTYVSDYFVNTPSSPKLSSSLPRCYFPYQVSSTDALVQHTTPKTSGKASGSLQPGALAWVLCQTPGSKVAKTKVWDRVAGNVYVTDRYVENSSNSTYSKPIPRCY